MAELMAAKALVGQHCLQKNVRAQSSIIPSLWLKPFHQRPLRLSAQLCLEFSVHSSAFTQHGKRIDCTIAGMNVAAVLEFGERLDLVLWETCHIYATCQAYRAEADFQHSPISKRAEYAGLKP